MLDNVSRYLTEEDFLIAESNGISRKNAYARFYEYGWPKEKAITQRVVKGGLWGQYKDRCQETGVNQDTFLRRVRKGMSPEEASSIPTGQLQKAPPLLTKELKDIARKNGISKGALDQRVYHYRWPVERAITEPIHTEFRKQSIKER